MVEKKQEGRILEGLSVLRWRTPFQGRSALSAWVSYSAVPLGMGRRVARGLLDLRDDLYHLVAAESYS